MAYEDPRLPPNRSEMIGTWVALGAALTFLLGFIVVIVLAH
jgi:hypothetical protein